MAAQKGHTKAGGRKKGTPNKVGWEIRSAIRLHGPELVEELLRLCKDEDARVRSGAVQAALDRGYGKAVQHIEAELSVYDSLGLAEQQALLAALEMLDVADVEVAHGLVEEAGADGVSILVPPPNGKGEDD